MGEYPDSALELVVTHGYRAGLLAGNPDPRVRRSRTRQPVRGARRARA